MEEHFQHIEKSDPSYLLNSGEGTAGLLCPVLGSLVKDKLGCTVKPQKLLRDWIMPLVRKNRDRGFFSLKKRWLKECHV